MLKKHQDFLIFYSHLKFFISFEYPAVLHLVKTVKITYIVLQFLLVIWKDFLLMFSVIFSVYSSFSLKLCKHYEYILNLKSFVKVKFLFQYFQINTAVQIMIAFPENKFYFLY